jgi:CRP/FNR family transcriptional regulator, cyclic AMP receptor protein
MSSPAVLDVFNSHAFLSNLSEWVRMRLAQGVMPFTAAPGEYLAREGQVAGSFYLIQEGHVEIGTRDNDQHVTLQTVGPGDVVGWSWIIPPHRWQFDCRAADAVKGLRFDAAWLREQCETDRELGYHVVKHLLGVMASRLAATRLLTRPWTGQPHVTPAKTPAQPKKRSGTSAAS